MEASLSGQWRPGAGEWSIQEGTFQTTALALRARDVSVATDPARRSLSGTVSLRADLLACRTRCKRLTNSGHGVCWRGRGPMLSRSTRPGSGRAASLKLTDAQLDRRQERPPWPLAGAIPVSNSTGWTAVWREPAVTLDGTGRYDQKAEAVGPLPAIRSVGPRIGCGYPRRERWFSRWPAASSIAKAGIFLRSVRGNRTTQPAVGHERAGDGQEHATDLAARPDASRRVGGPARVHRPVFRAPPPGNRLPRTCRRVRAGMAVRAPGGFERRRGTGGSRFARVRDSHRPDDTAAEQRHAPVSRAQPASGRRARSCCFSLPDPCCRTWASLPRCAKVGSNTSHHSPPRPRRPRASSPCHCRRQACRWISLPRRTRTEPCRSRARRRASGPSSSRSNCWTSRTRLKNLLQHRRLVPPTARQVTWLSAPAQDVRVPGQGPAGSPRPA